MIHEWKRTHITAYPFDNPFIRSIIAKSIRRQNELTIGDGIPRPLDACDPFANSSFTTKNPQGINFITNDLNLDMPTDFHMEANDFGELMKTTSKEFDLLLWDPPYNLTQLKRQYEGIGMELKQWQTLNPWGRAKDALAECIRLGGHVISFGFGSRGFSKRRGFETLAIYNLEPTGTEYRYNIQVIVEQKVQRTLDYWNTEEE